MKNIYFAVLVVAFSCLAQAQSHDLGKVTIAELEQKNHPSDPSAVAAILSRTGRVDFQYIDSKGSFNIITTIKTRIKIYKKEGYDWANAKVGYYKNGAEREVVQFSDAATYNLVNGKIVKTKLKSEGEFDEEVNKYWGRKKITMPAVQEGSVIEYQYAIVSPNIGMFPDWDFQAQIPVNYSEFKTNIPEYFVYNPNQKGYIFPKVAKGITTQSIIFQDSEQPLGLGSRIRGAADKVDYKVEFTTYTAENLPGLSDINYVNNIQNYISGITHELSAVRYPGATLKTFSTDWEAVAKTIYDSDDFGGELAKNGYFSNDMETVLNGLTTPEQKAMAIFSFVKSNVSWNGLKGYYCNDGVKKAYKDKTGNAAEINLMLVSMLREAGLTANPVLVSTRENGISFFPNRTAFNYVIGALEIGNETFLLDATEKFSTPNVLPLRDLNWNGRLMRPDASSIAIPMMPESPSKEVVNMIYSLGADGNLDGKVRRQLSDQMALDFRQKNIGHNKESYLENLENQNDKIAVADYVRDNETDLSKPIVESYSFTQSNGFESIGDKLYLSPMLFLKSKENPFKIDAREIPVDFGYPSSSKYNISIEIPAGYTLESVPEALNITTEGDLGTFKYAVAASGKLVQISVTTEIRQSIVPGTMYPILKDFFQRMVDKQNDKIVFKKI
jgi:hypothetical protein